MKRKSAAIPKGFLILYIILSITIVIMTISFILSMLDYSSGYSRSASAILNQLDTGNYEEAYRYTVTNQSYGENKSSYSEPYAVSEYWHNSIYYYAFADTDEGGYYKQKMEANKEKAGSLQYIIDDMDKMLKPYAK